MKKQFIIGILLFVFTAQYVRGIEWLPGPTAVICKDECGAWHVGECGEKGCAPNEQYKKRSCRRHCHWGTESRCVPKPYCPILTPTLTPTPTPALPIGYHEPTNPVAIPSCNQVTGWTCDGDKFDQPLDVHIYDGGTFLAAVNASVVREPAVGALCGGFTNHGFNWVIPDSLKDGNNHDINVYAINIDKAGVPVWPASPNPLLSASPHTINCTLDPWYKLAGASLYKNGAVNNFIPTLPQAYDTDDTTDRFLIIRDIHPPRVMHEGIIMSQSSIYLGSGAQTSTNQWRRQNYTRSLGYLGNMTSFIDYVKLKKKFQEISSVDDIASDTISIMNGPVTLHSRNMENVTNAVLIVDGDITINEYYAYPFPTFNPNNNSIALIATGTINISKNITQINGILIANQVDISYDENPTTHTLKINGNLITTNDLDNPKLKRKRTDQWHKPSLFVVFNPDMYVDLLNHLSVIMQEDRQIK